MLFQPNQAVTRAATVTTATASRASLRSLRTAIKIILQYDGCRSGVEACLSRAPILVRQRKPALSFSAREPLVLQHNRQRGFRFEPPRKLLDPRRHLRRRSIKTTRQSDHDGADAIFLSGEARNLGHDEIECV